MSKTPMRFILLAPDSMQKIPKEVDVIKTKTPSKFENMIVIIRRIAKTIKDK